MKQRRNTILLFIIIVVLTFGSILIQKIFLGKEGAKAIITQRGVVTCELPLNKDTTLTLDDGIGGTNTLVIENNSIHMTDANCPDLICVHTGTIANTGEVIACLPHSLIITISTGTE